MQRAIAVAHNDSYSYRECAERLIRDFFDSIIIILLLIAAGQLMLSVPFFISRIFPHHQYHRINTINPFTMDEKAGVAALRDHDIMGDKMGASHDERMHWGVLTEEELVIQTKLKKRIDFVIMPCVITVYLMNYIDRYAQQKSHTAPLSQLTTSQGIISRLQNCKDW